MLHDMPHTVIASAQPSCMWRSPQAQDTSLQTLSGYCTSSATQGWKMTSRASGSLLQNRTAFSIDAQAVQMRAIAIPIGTTIVC